MGIITILLFVCFFLVLAALAIGLIVMIRGGKLNKKLSNKLMVMRVVFQGLAILLIAILVFMSKSKGM